jgi:hypothetical protein
VKPAENRAADCGGGRDRGDAGRRAKQAAANGARPSAN